MGPAIGADNPYASLQLHRYPDPLYLPVKQKIADFRGHGLRPEQIFFGVGSDEAIDILFRIFCSPGTDNVVITPPTYGMYKVCAKVNDVEVISAPLTPDFDLDVPATLAAVTPNTKLVFVCSPGNPTCKCIPNSDVEAVLKAYTTGLVVVDEAYIDFSGTESACSLLATYPNVVVLQTLSKAFGLAGIRLGMAIAHPDVIQLMNNVKAPYNINKLTASIVDSAFDNLETFHSNVKKLLEEREFLLQGLKAMTPVKKIHHTDSNFILFVIPKAQELYKTMADSGIVCRYR